MTEAGGKWVPKHKQQQHEAFDLIYEICNEMMDIQVRRLRKIVFVWAMYFFFLICRTAQLFNTQDFLLCSCVCVWWGCMCCLFFLSKYLQEILIMFVCVCVCVCVCMYACLCECVSVCV